MTDERRNWMRAKTELTEELKILGFPVKLGDAVIKNLGSPKAMDRMASYLRNVKPKSVELVVDEMLAICSEIEAWKDRKAGRE